MAVVLITGCSSGIGPRTALAFARRGDRVYATMRRAERGRELVDRAASEGLDVRVLELDVTDDASVQQAVQEVLVAEGRIDVVVNNAGLVHVGSVELLSDEIWSYMASKHSLSVLSESLAMELEPFGTRVISIEPGFVRTPVIEKASRPGAESPYRALDEAVATFLGNGCAGGADPDSCAEAIVDAVAHDDGRIHYLVGEDAQIFVDTYASSSDAEMAAFFKEVIGLTSRAAAAV